MKTAILLRVIPLMPLLLVACSGTRSVSTNPTDMRGDWELETLKGTEIQAGEGEAYTLSFNLDGTIAGRAGCNYYAGEYMAEEEGGVLNLKPFATTKADCGEESSFEEFIKAVRDAQSFEVREGSRLVLMGDQSGETVFTRMERAE